LVLSLIGGWMFDAFGPWSTFFMVGILNAVVAVGALWLGQKEAKEALPT
jgi:predicted MFS family arabinose efflux permease